MAGKRVPCPACKAMLNLPTLEQREAKSVSPVLPDILDVDLDDIGFKLAEITPKTSAKSAFAAEHLGLEAGELKESEFSYPCKVCGTTMYAKPSEIGSMVHCPDCYSEYSVPSAPVQKARPRDPDLSKIADVTLLPAQGGGVRSQEFGRSTADDYLARAAKEVDEQDQDAREEFYDFDASGWLKRTFAFLGDPSLIVIAMVSGAFMGGTLIGASVVSQMAAQWRPDQAEATGRIGFLVVLVLIGIPLLAITLANGISILEASANKMKRIPNWPIFNPAGATSEMIVVIAAFVVAVLPGGLIGWLGSWGGLIPSLRMGLTMFSAYGLYPIILLGMLDNQSVSEPYSKAVIESMRSKADAWGAMYLLSGLAMAFIFVLYLVASVGTAGYMFFSGLLFPILVFFIFHQMGVLASRIAEITNLAFEGEESDARDSTGDVSS